MKLSIVVPCHNEALSINPFYEAVTSVIDGRAADVDDTPPCPVFPSDMTAELIFVDDGSKDDTLALIKQLAVADERVRFVSLSRNFGKESAIYAGLENASGDYIAIMDADLQDPPSMLPAMLVAVLERDCDVARARRVTRKGEPPIRSLCARLFYKIMNAVSDTNIADGARDYQVMTRQVADAILSMHEYNRFFKGISGWVGFKTEWFEYENTERVGGESQWSFMGLAKYALDGIISFSATPLHVSSAIGGVGFVIALILVAFVMVRALLFGDPVAGWPSTICLILLIGSIQFLCLGIMGDYISKIYLESKRRPIYIVRDTNIGD